MVQTAFRENLPSLQCRAIWHSSTPLKVGDMVDHVQDRRSTGTASGAHVGKDLDVGVNDHEILFSSQMPADGLAKAELVNTSGALEHVIKTSHFALVQEQATMQQRGEQLWLKLQSRAVAEQTRRETMASPSESALDKALVTVSCVTKPSSSGPEGRLRAKSSRDSLRDEIEQSSARQQEAETIQRAIEIASQQQDDLVDLTPVESTKHNFAHEHLIRQTAGS